MEIIHTFVSFCTDFISQGGMLFGFFLILLESFIPVLPLGVFVALNVNAFGDVVGICLSWIATCLGCFISFTFFSFLSDKLLYSILFKKSLAKIEKSITKFRNISFPNLVLVVSLPFTPAFLVNIICGIVRIGRKKFLAAIIIGKVFMVLFWGYVSKSFIESMTDINTIIIISCMLVVAYVISKIVSKKVNLD